MQPPRADGQQRYQKSKSNKPLKGICPVLGIGAVIKIHVEPDIAVCVVPIVHVPAMLLRWREAAMQMIVFIALVAMQLESEWIAILAIEIV